ncbi:MAG: hypothetical protein MUE85_02320 [Microscillaceae bacterium]|jgi:hypothetical protein|nr:hypothetical protein [Microscillaceae bacterium]
MQKTWHIALLGLIALHLQFLGLIFNPLPQMYVPNSPKIKSSTHTSPIISQNTRPPSWGVLNTSVLSLAWAKTSTNPDFWGSQTHYLGDLRTLLAQKYFFNPYYFYLGGIRLHLLYRVLRI